MSKNLVHGGWLFLTALAMLLITACAGTPETAPTTATITQTVVAPNPTSTPQPLSTPTPPEPQPSPTSAPPPGPLVFRNGLVVTAAGEDPIPGGAVVIENGRISAVGPEAGLTFPEGAVVIDLEGRTILPGLVDARASALLKFLNPEDGQLDSVYVEVYLRGPLKTGVTTLRATGWTWEEMQHTPELKAALQAYGNTVPTVLIAGASLAHSEGPAVTKYYPDQTVGVGSVEEARQTTEDIIELGADQVNFLMSSGPSLNDPPEERVPLLTLEMLTEIVEAAHAQGKQVVGQALFPEEAFTAIEAGVDGFTSWPSLTEPMPEDLIEEIVSHSIPVLSGFSVVVPQEGDVRRFLDAGGTLVFGTFAPNSGVSPVSEFLLMEVQGMTPMEMITSATFHAANAIGLGDVVGTLEVGKQADIIVVDGDLFEDNFTSVIGDVVYVVKNGELVVQPDV